MTTRTSTICMILLFLALPFVPEVTAQEHQKETDPDQNQQRNQEQEAEENVLDITVAEVKGTCDLLPPEQKEKESPEWNPAEKGETVEPGTQLSTGFRSRMTLNLADRGAVIIGALTQGEIGPLVEKEGTVTGHLNVKTGKSRIHVKEEQTVASFRVTTPRVTAAVKGSVVEILARGDKGDRIRVWNGHMEAPDPSFTMLLTGSQRAYQRYPEEAYYRAIRAARMDFVAKIAPDGATEIESLAEMQELSQSTVALLGTGLGNKQAASLEGFRSKRPRTEDQKLLQKTPKQNRTAVVDYVDNLGLNDLGTFMSGQAFYLTGDSTDPQVEDASADVDEFHDRFGVGTLMDRYFDRIYVDYEAGESGNPFNPQQAPGEELEDHREQNNLPK